MKLYMIRHGETLANTNYTYCGTTDVSVTMEGVRKLAALRIAGGYPDVKGFDIYTSGLLRTEQTLRALYWNLNWRIKEPRFAEMDFGIFEGKTYDELKDTKEYQDWLAGDHMANVIPGGESGNQVKNRVLEAVNELIEKDNDCLVICHGGTIAILFTYLFPDSGLNWYEIQPENGKGYMFEFEDGKAVRWERVPKVQPAQP